MMGMVKEIFRAILGRLRLLRLRIAHPRLSIDSRGFYCGRGCFASRKNTITIARNFYMGNFCHLAADAVIGADVLFASYVSLVGGDHKIDNIVGTFRDSGRDVLKTIRIADNVWVGHGAILMHGISIGSGSVIAAGAVVTSDVQENAIVGGNPARLIRYRETGS